MVNQALEGRGKCHCGTPAEAGAKQEEEMHRKAGRQVSCRTKDSWSATNSEVPQHSMFDFC